MATNILQKAAGASPTEISDSQVFDDGTNVGVGTTSPSAKVHVVDTSQQLRLAYDGSNFTGLTVNSSGVLNVNAVASSPEVSLSLNGNERMHLRNNNVQWDVDNVPTADNTYKCGTGSVRWSLVRGVTITSGDLRFENDLVLTEHYNVGTGVPRGLAFIDDRNAGAPRLLAFLSDDGVLFAGGIRPLSELPGTIGVASQHERNQRTLDELEKLNR